MQDLFSESEDMSIQVIEVKAIKSKTRKSRADRKMSVKASKERNNVFLEP